MSPVIAALPMPSSPVGGAGAGVANGLDPSAKTETNGVGSFAAVLTNLVSDIGLGSRASAGKADLAPGESVGAPQPTKTTGRRGESKSRHSENAAGLIAANLPVIPTPISPNNPHSTFVADAEGADKLAFSASQTILPSTANATPTASASQSATPTVSTSQETLPAPALAASQALDGIARLVQANVEAPVSSPATLLESKSALLQGLTFPAPTAASGSVTPISGHDRDQLPTKDAEASALANVVAGPHVNPPAGAATANSAASLPAQIHDQISGRLDQVQQGGRVDAQFNLHPPELGRVQLHLTLEDGHLNVRMVVQDDNAKRLIDQQAEPLRVRFAEMGVSVGQFDVRRDGGSANQEQQQPTAPSAQTLQPSGAATSGRQKSYAKVANSAALVDLIA